MSDEIITIDLRLLNVSGIGTYLRNVIPGIIMEFRSNRFTLIGDKAEIGRLGLPNDRRISVVVAKSKMYSLFEQAEIPDLIPKNTRIYFAPHYNIPLLYRGSMLVVVHDLFHLAMPDLVDGVHKSLYARFMFYSLRRKADAIITVSRFTKNELIRFTGRGRQQIHPIHLGVERSWFDVKQDATKALKKPYLLYIGNVKPHKNLGALIKAFELISSEISHDLILAGKKDGFITGDRNVLMAAEKLQGRVLFTGYMNEVLLKQYVAQADALVFPSLYEGFGLPPLEAMAAGCPVIVSNVASIPEICGDAAMYCDSYKPRDIADKILEVIRNKQRREELIGLGLAHARYFTWDKCVKETCGVIDKLLRDQSLVTVV
jgi:glycosyltransferase involved in cell wall biosynthesis